MNLIEQGLGRGNPRDEINMLRQISVRTVALFQENDRNSRSNHFQRPRQRKLLAANGVAVDQCQIDSVGNAECNRLFAGSRAQNLNLRMVQKQTNFGECFLGAGDTKYGDEASLGASH